jgi:hypothetical protein
VSGTSTTPGKRAFWKPAAARVGADYWRTMDREMMLDRCLRALHATGRDLSIWRVVQDAILLSVRNHQARKHHGKAPKLKPFEGMRREYLPALRAFARGDITRAQAAHLRERLGAARKARKSSRLASCIPYEYSALAGALLQSLDRRDTRRTVEHALNAIGAISAWCHSTKGYEAFMEEVLRYAQAACDETVEAQAALVELTLGEGP